MSAREIVLSGIRPTGAAHLGNYVGALRNWVRLQETHDCYFCIVDWHALSSEYAAPQAIRENVFDLACDLLSVGLDPTSASSSSSRPSRNTRSSTSSCR